MFNFDLELIQLTDTGKQIQEKHLLSVISSQATTLIVDLSNVNGPDLLINLLTMRYLCLSNL